MAAGHNERMGMTSYETVILGAGIAGASLAWRLAVAGHRVLLLEREAQPGYHATGRSAALFMESYGPPQVRALTRASRAFYRAPPSGFAPAPLLQPRGALYVAWHGQADALAALHAELAETTPGLQVLDATATVARAPCLRADTVHASLYDPDTADLDVHAILQGFLRGLVASGGTWRAACAPTAAAHDGQAWTLSLPGGERLRAATVVNATGAWVDETAALFGARAIGIQPCRRSAFTFALPAGVDASNWPAISGVDEAEGWYIKPDAGQMLGSPANADPVPPHDVLPEALDIATGIHRIEAATSLRIRRPSATWAGLRSFVADGEMVVGFDEACPGFFWLAGQGGYGIQSAPGVSQLAASLVLRQRLPEALAAQGVDAAALSPRRLRRLHP